MRRFWKPAPTNEIEEGGGAQPSEAQVCATQQFQEDMAVRFSQSGPVVGFDFSILLTTLLPVVIDMVSGCLTKNTPASVASRLAGGRKDFWLKQQTAVAVRRELKEQGLKLDGHAREAVVNDLLDSWAADQKRTEQMVAEINSQEFAML